MDLHVMKRKGTSFKKGSEMAAKKYKADCSTDGEAVPVECVREHTLSDNPIRMDKSFLEFPRLSQEELKEIYGKRRQRPVIRNNSTEESEESEEEEGLTKEELKQTKGYQSLMNCLRILAQQQSV